MENNNQVRRYKYILLFLLNAFCCDAFCQETNYVEGQVIVRLRPNSSVSTLIQAYQNIGLTTNRNLSEKMNIWLLDYNPEIVSIDSCIRIINSNENVVAIQANHIVNSNTDPNDTHFSDQYALTLIQATNAWNITHGGHTVQNDEIVVAVVDNGFYLGHEDLDFWKNSHESAGDANNDGCPGLCGVDDDGDGNIDEGDKNDDDENGYIDDIDGWNGSNGSGTVTTDHHGTQVSGIIGAKGNNNKGTTGVNWNVKIMPVQKLNQQEAAVVACYAYVLEQRELYNRSNGTKGAYVVVSNASFSVTGDAASNSVWCDIYEDLGHAGVLNVNAPTNNNKEIIAGNVSTGCVCMHDFPALCTSEYLIVVTNTDENDDLANNAPWGKSYVDMTAPGKNVYTTDSDPNNLYINTESGTSLAAPQVSGAIALMYAAACDPLITASKSNPSSVALSMKQILFESSDPIPLLFTKIGYGRLNVYRSILHMSEQYHTTIDVSGTASAPKQYDAINSITVHDYTAGGSGNIIFRAGEQIIMTPPTILAPSSGEVIHAFIDAATFDCAIPPQPLFVDLTVPVTATCVPGLLTTCNAVPSGGKPPYNYVWTTRLLSSSTNVVHTQNSPNFSFATTEDFFVTVEVTDDLDQVVLSEEKKVECNAARMSNPNDSTKSPTDSILYNKKPIDQVSAVSNNTKDLYQTFSVFPNPSNGNVTITFTLPKESPVSIKVYDNTGKKVADVLTNKNYEMGKYSLEYDGKDLSSGLYFYYINTNEGSNALKLMISK